MFPYSELNKDNNTATISLDGSYKHDVYVPVQPERDEDFGNFTL